MDHKLLDDGHQWILESGASVQVRSLRWGDGGKVSGDVAILAPDGLSLAAANFDLSDPRMRYTVGRDAASRNGNDPSVWNDALLGVYVGLLSAHREDVVEPFDPIDMASEPVPEPQRWTVGKLIPEGLPTEMHGDSGVAKSTIASNIAFCIALGTPFLGHETIQGSILYLDYELTKEITSRRLHELAAGMELDAPPPGFFYQALHQNLTTTIDAIRRWCENNRPALVIVDSFGPASGSDPLDHKAAIEMLNAVRSLGLTVLMVDHQAKPAAGGLAYGQRRAFGSSYKQHLVRSAIQVEKVAGREGKISLVIRQQKSNFSHALDDIPAHLHFDQGRIWLSPASASDPEFLSSNSLNAKQKVEAFLGTNGPSTIETLMEELDLKKQTVSNVISGLRSRGRIPPTTESKKDEHGNRLYELSQR